MRATERPRTVTRERTASAHRSLWKSWRNRAETPPPAASCGRRETPLKREGEVGFPQDVVSEVELNEPAVGGYSVSLPTFEGPLDLLLHLCQKHEIDILDIPIAFITEKYLEYLAVMQLMNLDVASEYLVMAATLAHIKSKMLLPAPPPGQEDEVAAEEADPREALIRRLLEYQKYKQAAEELQARGVAGRDVFTRGAPIEEAVHTGLPPLAQVPLFALVEAFQSVLAKSKVKLSHDVVHERITLTDRINELVDILRVRRRVAFEDLFEGQHTRFDLVITFLALLEMTRLRMTRLYQADFDSTIYVEFTAQVGSSEEEAAGAEQAASANDETQATAASLDTDASDGASAPTDAPDDLAADATSPPSDEPPTARAEDDLPEDEEAAFATEPPATIATDAGAFDGDDELSLATDPPTAFPSDEGAFDGDDELSLATDPPATIASDEVAFDEDVLASDRAALLEDPLAEPSVSSLTSPLHTIPSPPPEEGLASDAQPVVTSDAPDGPRSEADDAPASHVSTIAHASDEEAADAAEASETEQADALARDVRGAEAAAPQEEAETHAASAEDPIEATGQASTDDTSSGDNAESADASAAEAATPPSSSPAATPDSPSSSSDPS